MMQDISQTLLGVKNHPSLAEDPAKKKKRATYGLDGYCFPSVKCKRADGPGSLVIRSSPEKFISHLQKF